jgi:cell division septation protein DedD
MRDINLASLRSQERSRRSLIFIGLICVVFGSLALVFALFMKPEVQRPQFVGKRIRLPIMSVEKEEGPRIPGIVEEGGMEEKPLEGGILEEGKLISSESPEPSIAIQETGVSKEMLILGEKEASDEEQEVTIAEREGKRAEIEGKEEEKTKVAMVEESKGLAIPERKVTTGRYTLNIASFRNESNADQLLKELEDKGYEAFVEKANIPGKGTWYRVAVGRFSSRGEALAFARGLKEKGVNYSFVRKITEVKK